jgi:transaldolase
MRSGAAPSGRAAQFSDGLGLVMKFFVDTADVAEIRALAETGLVDGVTTNPTLFARAWGDKASSTFMEALREICALVEGPVSAETTADSAEGMAAEGRVLAAVAPNVVVKTPLTWEGLKACRILSREGIKVNATLCFSANQALLAAKAGATYVSPFVGRLDDVGEDGAALLGDIRKIYSAHLAFTTKILAASLRTPDHVRRAALAGADAVTMPPKVMWRLADHPLTEKGVAQFKADWARAGQAIV